MYRHTQSNTSIQRLSDNAFIPFAPGNRDYQEYLEWVAAGNEPEPWVEPPKPVPTQVTAYQAKIQLVRAGLYSAVETAVASSNNLELQVAWATATTFDRNSTFILALQPELGLTDAQVDDLFQQASQIS